MLTISKYTSPVGMLTLASDENALTGLWIEGQKYFGSGLRLDAAREGENAVLTAAARWLDRYFAGECPAPGALPVAPAGSAFRRRVLDALVEIPSGEVVTYGELAARLGSSARAVGGAVGHNPISIIIPCHRVVGADGSLTGYAAGVEAKRRLLRLEGVQV